MTWASWLLGLIRPVLYRALAALGLGYVTYSGMDTALNIGIGHIKNNVSGISPEILQILAIAGIFKAMGIILGGVAASIAMTQLSNITLLTRGR